MKQSIGGILLVLLACTCRDGKASDKPVRLKHVRRCFEVTANGNSAATQALFHARRCQGGGVTWGAILHALVERRGTVRPVEVATPGWTGGVYTLKGARLSIDDEAEAAQFCSDSAPLVDGMRAEYKKVNADPVLLKNVMSEASALELECSEADGREPVLPQPLPPPKLGASVIAETAAEIAAVRKAIHAQPDWCFPANDATGAAGALHFFDDGSVTWTRARGAGPLMGRWTTSPPEQGDPRVEVVAGILEHFDIGPTGRLGFPLIGPHRIKREDLEPGDACVRGK